MESLTESAFSEIAPAEQDTPPHILARAIIGGVSVSMVVTIILVPCAIYLMRARNGEVPA